jgi:hypothetical protein
LEKRINDMGKDPAVLFYTGDFLVGTMKMNYAQKGKYIQLLCLQHQDGHLSDDDMLSVCGDYDEKIFSKFVKDENGRYYNERMEQESIKRRRFVESRQRNLVKTDKEVQVEEHKEHHMEAHMGNHTESRMENENRNRNDNINNNGKRVYKKKEFIPPTYEEVLSYAKARNREDLAKKFYDYFTAGEWVDSNGKKVERWKAKFITWENNTEKPKEKEIVESSFDVDDFFAAAMARTYGGKI